ncbi:hypothetical protein G6686_01695 [Polynucleobacter paneuropaeus]|nr:hypothetical protein G6686_01695 [Polynucleobacter paneuropaeus]
MKVFSISLLLLGFCFLLANRDITMFYDAENYADYYHAVIIGNPVNAESSFIFISQVVDFLGLGLSGLFFAYAFFGFFLKIAFYVFKLPKYIHLILLYLSSYFVVHDLVQIRIGAALGISLWAIYFIGKNNILRATTLFIIAVGIHLSALILCFFSIFFFLINKIKERNKIFYSLSLIIFLLSIIILLSNVLFGFSLKSLIVSVSDYTDWIPLRYKENYFDSDVKIGFGKVLYSLALGVIALIYLKHRYCQNFLSTYSAVSVVFAFLILVTMADFPVIGARIADTFLFLSPLMVYGVYLINKISGRILFFSMLTIQLINILYFSTVIKL